MTPTLTFDPAAHEYRLDGKRLLSVTQVLERAGIIDYSRIPPATREMALARGRAVHEAIALDIEGDLDESSVEPIMGYVEAARAARAQLGIARPDRVECIGYHPRYLYAGTVDFAHGYLVGDWKCNKVEWWVRLQTAAYAAMQPEPGLFRRVGVELHGDGKFHIEPFEARHFRRDMADFLAVFRTAQLLDENVRGRR